MQIVSSPVESPDAAEIDDAAGIDEAVELSAAAYQRAVFTKGKTKLTHDYIDAVSRRAVELSIGNPEIIYLRAEVLHTIGQQEEALQTVAELRKVDPDHPGYRLLQGRILWDLERFDEAARVLHSAVNSDNAGAPVAVYKIQLENGDVHQLGVRWEKEIREFIIDRDTESSAYTAWRAEGVAQFAGLSDSVLYQSTWTNPTPEVKIKTVDFLSFESRAQPFLVAMSVESFSEDLNGDPVEAVRLSQLALRKLTGGAEVNERVVQQVRNLIEKVISDAPQDPDVWRAVAGIRLRLGELELAIEAVERSLSLNPVSSESWKLKGDILGKLKRFAEAVVAKKKQRKVKLRELITERDPAIDARFIDLSSHCNVGLNEFPYQTLRPTRTLTECFDTIMPGLNTFGGMEFDVRGLIALEGKETELSAGATELSRRVLGIQVGQTASAIHLLHGAGWGDSDPHGTCIGKLIVNYEDGESLAIEIKAGEHVRDWFLTNDSKRKVNGGKLAWVHPSKEVSGRDIGLYTLTWQNPQPERKIVAFDYESTMSYGAPFLLGVTLEK